MDHLKSLASTGSIQQSEKLTSLRVHHCCEGLFLQHVLTLDFIGYVAALASAKKTKLQH